MWDDLKCKGPIGLAQRRLAVLLGPLANSRKTYSSHGDPAEHLQLSWNPKPTLL